MKSLPSGKRHGDCTEFHDFRPVHTAMDRRARGNPPSHGGSREEEYLVLTDHRNRLVEFTDGFLDILPMPTDKHQSILKFLLLAFLGFAEPRGGKVHFAPLRLQIRPGKFREPDLLLLLSAADPAPAEPFLAGRRPRAGSGERREARPRSG